jgi:carboxypeptidase Q
MNIRNVSVRALAIPVLLATVFSLAPFSQAQKQKKGKAAAPATAPAMAGLNDDQPDLEVVYRLRDEEFHHGQVMNIMEHLTDSIGPRLTGSPNMKKANDWTRDQLAEWGLVNAHVEPWGTFGRGWAYQSVSVRMTSPDYMQFLAMPQAWTPGTNGPVTGQPILVEANTPADLEKYKGQLAGKIVLLGDIRYPDPDEKPNFSREDEASLRKMSEYEIPRAGGPMGIPADRMREFRQRFEFQRQLQKFLADEKPAAVLQPTRQPGQDGTIFVQSGGAYQEDQPQSTVPMLTLAIEHYNRVARLLQAKQPVTLEVNVQAQFYNDDDKAYDTVAEIPGSDPTLKEQLVMLGGHMDSWHAGEGATDNGAGVAVAMEAVRLIKSLGLQPRRTIRVALWSGEEEGLLGSRGYVKNHFGGRPEARPTAANRDLPSFMRPPAGPLELKPEQKLVSGYFNYDNGTGRIRGIYLQENLQVAPIFRKWMAPFRDLGMTTIAPGNTGGTDHLSFDAVDIPGFQFIQDPMDYGTLTHHSNLDVYEHIRPDDLKQAAVIMASFVYNTAMRDEMLPRKPLRPEDLPKQ